MIKYVVDTGRDFSQGSLISTPTVYKVIGLSQTFGSEEERMILEGTRGLYNIHINVYNVWIQDGKFVEFDVPEPVPDAV